VTQPYGHFVGLSRSAEQRFNRMEGRGNLDLWIQGLHTWELFAKIQEVIPWILNFGLQDLHKSTLPRTLVSEEGYRIFVCGFNVAVNRNAGNKDLCENDVDERNRKTCPFESAGCPVLKQTYIRDNIDKRRQTIEDIPNVEKI
jgi:hypothetical protein